MRPALAISTVVTVLALVGCDSHLKSKPSNGPTADQISTAKAKFLTAEAPAESQTVVEAISALSGEDSKEFTVVGVIGGMPNPFGEELQPNFPWVAEEASLFLVDPATAAEFEGDHAHAPGEECPFCLGKARDMVGTVAMVGLLDESEVTLPHRADRLLGLEEGTTVAVTGTASLLADMLVIEATAIHVLEPETSETKPPEAEVAEP